MEKTNIERALDKAIATLYFNDRNDYGSALWKIIELLGGKEAVELLEDDPESAYKIFCA